MTSETRSPRLTPRADERVVHSPAASTRSTALLTDRYELTMVDAALQDGTADRESVFEMFGRRLSGGRRYGVVAGTGRFLEALADFRFGDDELAYLREREIVSAQCLDWLADYRFSGDIRGYAEGDVYVPQSPLIEVHASFAEGVVLETLLLSTYNYDCSIATAASRMVTAAEGRSLSEMGSRRTGEWSAVAASRAAYIAGFDATSNLEAGRSYGVPTMGTAAHSFTLLHDSERDAFEAQIRSLGSGTTLLVDTYDVDEAIRTAVDIAGPELGAVRLDSGDLPSLAREVRQLLDSLGATKTRITVTNDLDEYAILGLAGSPVDGYGVGTSLVTGSGYPAAGLVYKLVRRRGDDGEWRSVAKHSEGKASVGGDKTPVRRIDERGRATGEVVYVDREPEVGERDRLLHVDLVRGGEIDTSAVGAEGVARARAFHERVRGELPPEALRMSAGDPFLSVSYYV